ncbi:telomerase reverse transcriptase-like [Zingiber officinale]|uniref:telomerase reverse transcriptase-like n=1 Tax=Zingiber officinale TaxID=94328 RepID=UPI001C4B5A07|nr:telomerase reverse transcriptase-like [Zingiber officinale]
MARRQKRRRRGSAPVALRIVYRNRVKTLEKAILSLLPCPPSSPAECSCRGRRCLGCDSSSFLLRKEDPIEYRFLLTRSFCVVSCEAPAPPKVFYDDTPVSFESLCCTVRKSLCTSTSSLYNPSWDWLLSRIGSQLLLFLLRFSSIFISLQRGSYYQITGHQMDKLIKKSKSMKNTSLSRSQQPELPEVTQDMAYTKNRLKRKRCEINQSSYARDDMLDPDTSSISTYGKENLLQLGSDIGPNCSDNPNNSSGLCSIMKSRKHRRLFSWQRGKKAKVLEQHITSPTEKLYPSPRSTTSNQFKGQSDIVLPKLSMQLQHLNNFSQVEAYDNQITQSDFPRDFGYPKQDLNLQNLIPSMCFYCLMIKSSQKVEARDQIKRSYIFYNSSSTYSVFPKAHILNQLKPNNSGAITLMKHIFGFPNGCKNFVTCLDSGYGCALKSQCLYHSLLHSLKSLIRNAQRCQRNRLLFKHCLQIFKEHTRDDNNSNSQKKGWSGPQQVSFIQMFGEAQYSDVELIGYYSKHHQVVSFIWAVCRSIVPVSLLGNSSCWRALQKNISKFVESHRYETFHLKQCVDRVKISSYPFLSKVLSSQCFCSGNSTSDSSECERITDRESNNSKGMAVGNLFLSWIRWFFSEIIVPVIAANFYVTERESRKYELFYYPMPVWKKLIGQTITSLVGEKFELADEAFIKRIIGKRSFGFSKARFVPKSKCLRTLANLKSSSKVKHSRHPKFLLNAIKQTAATQQKNRFCHETEIQYNSVNSVLKDALSILREVMAENPEKLGCSVFNYNDVYRKICHFLTEVKLRSQKTPQIYVVVVDVLKAFDSIDQEKLLSILENIIGSNEYVMRKHAKICYQKKSLRVLYKNIPYGSSCTSVVDPSAQISSYSNILVDQGKSEHIQRKEILHLLQEHLKHNILQIERKFYLQKVGISQGSVLSPLLCSCYYGDMENKVLLPYLEMNNQCLVATSSKQTSNATDGELATNSVSYHVHKDILDLGDSNLFDSNEHRATKANGLAFDSKDLKSGENLLIRFIDDFLFLSTSKDQAQKFFNRMRRGFHAYNCSLNKKKLGTNLDMMQSDHLIKKIYVGEDGIPFVTWSGLLLNCHTLEIQADYTRYLDTNMRSTMNVKAHTKLSYHLKAKLFHFAQTRCHPIFYDSNINSPSIVGLNVYQAFLLCAMKFHCYMNCIKIVIKLNPSYLLKIILNSFCRMYKQIRKLMCRMLHSFNIRASFVLEKKDVIWLGLAAFTWILQKKHSQHKKLLSLLRSRMETYGRVEDMSSHLRYAVDESHSSCFSKIKF